MPHDLWIEHRGFVERQPSTATASAKLSLVAMRLAESDSESELNDIAVKIRKLPVVGILLVELCERLTYYTLAGTQKIYLQNQLKKTPSTAAALNSVFSMLCYFWCIPGGLLADSIGRYKTIIAAGCVYAVGTICVGISVIYELQSSLGWLFMLGCLVLIAIGTGGIKPNIANFGADQIGDITEKQRECQKTFFSLFYLSINIGVLIAFGFLTNTTTGGLPGVVSPSEGYSFAYGSGAGCMILAVLIFISFTNSFTMLPGNGLGPVRRLVRYQCHSLKGGGWRAFLSAAGFCCLPLFYIVTLTDTLLSARGHASAAETFHDPCSAQIDTPPRRLHGGGGGGGVLSDIALALGAMACVFLVVPVSVKCILHMMLYLHSLSANVLSSSDHWEYSWMNQIMCRSTRVMRKLSNVWVLLSNHDCWVKRQYFHHSSTARTCNPSMEWYRGWC